MLPFNKLLLFPFALFFRFFSRYDQKLYIHQYISNVLIFELDHILDIDSQYFFEIFLL